MVKTRFLFLYLILFSGSLKAQQDISLSGVVLEQNSKHFTGKFKYISGVNIRSGSASTVSDVQGKFHLIFSDRLLGKTVRITARKSGMKLVNAKELESATVLGRIQPIKVFMTPAGQLAKAQIAYYQIAEDALYSKHDKILASLRTEGAEKDRVIEVLRKETNQEINSLSEAILVLENRLEEALKLAKIFTEEIAAINLDFASARYIRAHNAFQKGQLDSVLIILSLEQTRLDFSNLQEEKRRIENIKEEVNSREIILRDRNEQYISEQMLAARTAILKSEFRRAEDHYLFAVKADTLNFVNVMELCTFLFYQNKSDLVVYYSRMLERIAIDTLGKSIALDLLGLGLQDQGLQQEAVNEYHKSLKLKIILGKQNPNLFYLSLSQTLNHLGTAYSDLKLYHKAIEVYNEALKIDKALLKQNPADVNNIKLDLAITFSNVGQTFVELNHYLQASQAYIEAAGIYNELAKENPKQFTEELARLSGQIGSLFSDLNRKQEALESLSTSLKLGRILVQKNPDRYKPFLANSLINLGLLYLDLNRLGGALELLKEATEIFRSLAKQNPAHFNSDLALSLHNLGIIYNSLKQHWNAREVLVEAFEIRLILAKENFDHFEPDVASTLCTLGQVYFDIKSYKQALQYYKLGLERFEALAEENPILFEPDLAKALHGIGIIYKSLNQLSESLEVNHKALMLYKILAERNPNLYNSDLANSFKSLGITYKSLKRYTDAIEVFQEALNLFRILVKQDPSLFNSDLASTLNSFAGAYTMTFRYDKAIEIHNEALEIYNSLAKKDPGELRLILAHTYYTLAVNHTLITEFSIAANYFGTADSIYALNNENEVAIEYREKIKRQLSALSKPDALAKTLTFNAISHYKRKDRKMFNYYYKKALNEYEIAAKKYPREEQFKAGLVSFHIKLSWQALKVKGFRESEKFARKALEISPESIEVIPYLAVSLLFSDKFKEAEKYYKNWKNKLWPFKGYETFKEVFLADFNELQEVGITHPDITRIRKILIE